MTSNNSLLTAGHVKPILVDTLCTVLRGVEGCYVMREAEACYVMRGVEACYVLLEKSGL